MKSMAMQVKAPIQEESKALEHFIAFAKLGNRLPSQSEMQGRKTEKEIQHVAISHGYAKYSHGYAKFSHSMRKSRR